MKAIAAWSLPPWLRVLMGAIPNFLAGALVGSFSRLLTVTDVGSAI